jgi:hypothetical protein
VSGGQTGADRAALDFAIEHGFAHGGWCPRGRLAEDGPIPAKFHLQETPSPRYSQRTEWNIRDSDATVVFSIARKPAGGTALTLEIACQRNKPCLHLSRDEIAARSVGASAIIAESAEQLRRFLDRYRVSRLNVAGPRASQEHEVAAYVQEVLRIALCA